MSLHRALGKQWLDDFPGDEQIQLDGGSKPIPNFVLQNSFQANQLCRDHQVPKQWKKKRS